MPQLEKAEKENRKIVNPCIYNIKTQKPCNTACHNSKCKTIKNKAENDVNIISRYYTRTNKIEKSLILKLGAQCCYKNISSQRTERCCGSVQGAFN